MTDFLDPYSCHMCVKLQAVCPLHLRVVLVKQQARDNLRERQAETHVRGHGFTIYRGKSKWE